MRLQLRPPAEVRRAFVARHRDLFGALKGSAGGQSSILPTFTVICRGWKAAGKWLESGLPLFNGALNR